MKKTIITAADAAVVQQYLQGDRGACEAEQLRHRHYAAVSWDEALSKPSGYLSLDDTPAVCNWTGDFSAGAAAVEAAAGGLGYKQSTTLYAQQLQAQEVPVLRQLLQHAFAALPHLRQVLLVSSLDFDADMHHQQQHVDMSEVWDAAAAVFAKATRVASEGPVLWLYECSRAAILPPLQVRHAQVEDHDDLLPIMAAAAAGPCPSLATLPQSCKPEQPFALTRLISSQDPQNLVLVAEDNGKLVGLLVATLQLDVSLLIQAFDLGFCDAFMPPEVYEECESAAKHVAAEKAAGHCTGLKGGEGPAPDQPATDVRRELVPLLQAAFARRQQPMRKKEEKGTAAAAHSLVAITVLCMQPGYEERAIDFMPVLFQELPQQDFCALTLPYSAVQPPLARHMTLLRPVPGEQFPQVVLLLHKGSLAIHTHAEWEVRLAVPDDVVGLHGLIGGMTNSMDIQEAFLHAVGRQGAVVATVDAMIVGMLASSPCTAEHLTTWSASFKLGQVASAKDLTTASQHARVDAWAMSPVFAAHAGTMLTAALRLLHKAYLHYVLAPGQPAPAELLAVMQRQRSRRSRSSSLTASPVQETSATALLSFTKAMAVAGRHVVNAQIVIAGASDTGLSCLEHLLLQPAATFTNLTLIAPGGIRSDTVTGQFTPARVARLGLHTSVTVIDSHMVALAADEQLVMMADGSQLPYNVLAVTTGMQDQLGPAIAAAFPDAAHFVLPAQQLLASSITPDLAGTLHSVLVYGAGLHALDVLSALIDAGVNADAITWVCPGQEQEAAAFSLLRSLAKQLCMELPEPQQGRLLELTPCPDSSRAVAALQALDAGDDGPLQQMELDLLVGCGACQPSPVVASCLASAYIVWDGRLVVDSCFCSNDSTVMGAGPIAKFSRRYAIPEVKQEQYSSCELGVALAQAIIDRFTAIQPTSAGPAGQQGSCSLDSSSELANSTSAAPAQTDTESVGPQHLLQQQQSHSRLPALHQGKVLGCRLPGGCVFLCGGCPTAVASPQLAPPPGGCSLLSCAQDRVAVLNICLDASATIHSIAFLGAQGSAHAATAASLMSLVGLPFSYLAAGLGLPEELSKGPAGADDLKDAEEQAETSAQPFPGLLAGPAPGVWILGVDVLEVLQQPWSALMLHEYLPVLRQELMAAQELGPSERAAGEVSEQLVVEFLQGCRAELPGYQLSNTAAEIC